MKIFICYARQDSDVIESVRKAIERVGHVVWVDRRLQGGQAWWDVILSEIRACDVFMLALGPDSARSKACGSELAYATETRRHLLPIMVRDVDPRLFSEKIADFQYVDYRQQTVDNTLDIISSLSRIPPTANLPDPLPPPPDGSNHLPGRVFKDAQVREPQLKRADDAAWEPEGAYAG